MKLTRNLYYKLLNFFYPASYRWNGGHFISLQEKHSNIHSYGRVYEVKDLNDWNPGFVFGHSPSVFTSCNKVFIGSKDTDIPTYRNSASLLSALCNKVTCKDSNDVLYRSGSGIIMDSNFVPLVYAEMKKYTMPNSILGGGYEKKLICNTYIFKRENLVSKLILDTLVPLLLNNRYKNYTDDQEDYFTVLFKDKMLKDVTCPFRGVEFRPLGVDFWNSEFKGATVNPSVINEILKTTVFE